MKITDIRIHLPIGLLRIGTDEGIEGCCLGLDENTARHIQSAYRDYLIGQDPFDRQRIWEELSRRDRFQYLPQPVRGHVDVAIWDLLGKATGLPVYRLIGGFRDSIPAYKMGPNFDTVSACASGADAIGTAFETIRRGAADAMLAGGAEAAVTRMGLAAFHATRALSTRRDDDPAHASRPFDRERDGFVLAEGAAVLVLEERDFARRRGAPILAEMLGYGQSADAFHVTQPSENGEGAARAMRAALREAGLDAGAVSYINAHGTSTPLNDKFETLSIKAVFGEEALAIPISSTKSMIGHSLGAGGGIEAAVCVLSIRDGRIHPTRNLELPDPDCDRDYVPEGERELDVSIAMSNALGFGGHNSSLLFGRDGEPSA